MKKLMKQYSRSLPPQAPVVKPPVLNVKPPTTVKNSVSKPAIPPTEISPPYGSTERIEPRIPIPRSEGSEKLSYSLFILFSVHLSLVPAQGYLHWHTYTQHRDTYSIQAYLQKHTYSTPAHLHRHTSTPTQAHLHCTGIPTDIPTCTLTKLIRLSCF